MKRFDSPESLGALISICPPQDKMEEEEKYSEGSKGYSREFQAMLESLDQEDCGVELFAGKKRRLSSEQVKALEKHFEVENKLEPERKAKLADELGLQPRQVAIWFQNRRARWKTKQLEKDYGVLKANYNSLKLSYEDLQQQNQSLIDKVRLLKEKVCRGDQSEESSESLKEESPASENDDDKDLDTTDDFHASQRSSLVLKPPLSSSSGLEDHHGSLKFSLALNGSSSSSSSSSSSNSLMTNWPFQSPEISRAPTFPVKACQDQQHLMISPFAGSEEPNNCNNFFSVDQAPTLYWYFPHEQ